MTAETSCRSRRFWPVKTSRAALILASGAIAGACQAPPAARPPARPRNIVLVTVDTLRADRVGAYGYSTARTPAMDDIARRGVRFAQAFAPTPITLPSHASLLTGKYPARHGARHNGMAMNDEVPTLATLLDSAGFATGAFVSAFPLDRRFGLARGFDRYDDELGRGPDGRPRNERPGADTARRAIEWVKSVWTGPFFLWVHLFEPHAPYGVPGSGPAASRYDEEIALADRSIGELRTALANTEESTLWIVAADHGEAFGEHGEIGHSIFVYDTTLQVPLVIAGPGVPGTRLVEAAVSLVDLAPTVAALVGMTPFEADGVSLLGAMSGSALPARALYAESFAPLLDFGWSPLRSVREAGWKLIEAPRAELFDLARDPVEAANVMASEPQKAFRLRGLLDAGAGEKPVLPTPDAEAARRLRSLGYLSGSAAPPPGASRPDPKDRIVVASRLATVLAGELQGAALITTLEEVLREDPGNPQARLRLGFAELERGRCDLAEPHLASAVAAKMPSADAGLGLASCRTKRRDFAGANAALEQALEAEPGNPVVLANLGLNAFARGQTAVAIARLSDALGKDPDLHEARFVLARALATAGRRAEALSQAQTLASRLPKDAPEQREIARLIGALR